MTHRVMATASSCCVSQIANISTLFQPGAASEPSLEYLPQSRANAAARIEAMWSAHVLAKGDTLTRRGVTASLNGWAVFLYNNQLATLRNSTVTGWRTKQPISVSARQLAQKDASLEGLRGLACLSVFLGHCIFAFLPHTAEKLTRGAVIPRNFSVESVFQQPFFTVLYNGSFGVSLFFGLSGYVLTYTFFATKNINSLQLGAAKRYPRLALPAFASILFGFALLQSGLMFNQLAPDIGAAGWPMSSYSSPVTLSHALADGLFGAPLLGSVSLNPPLWTIQIEFLGSILLFAVYALFGTRRIWLNLVVFWALAALIFSSHSNQMHCLSIFFGSVLHVTRPVLLKSSLLCLGLIIAGLVCGAYDYSWWFDWARALPLPVAPAPLFPLAGAERYVFNAVGAVLLVAGILGCRPARSLLSTRVPVYLGKISFALYLLHWPVICSLSFGLMYALKVVCSVPYLTSLAMTFVATTVVCLVLASLVERFIDRPSTRLSNAFSRYVLGVAPSGVEHEKPLRDQRSAVTT